MDTNYSVPARDDPLAKIVPIDDYINERFVGFQETINQILDVFEQHLLERLTSINPFGLTTRNRS